MPGTGPRAIGEVQVNDVTRRFGARTVLDHLSFDVPSGGYVALIGPNGSGKTTVVRLLAGLLDADKGSVDVCGGRPGRGQAGYLPAGDRGLHFRLTGRQNLEFFARAAGTPTSSLGVAIDSAVEAVGATGLLSTLVGECSTGERRRLALAQAIIARPPVLLLDEPFADLDADGTACVEQLSARWTREGGAVIAAAPSEVGLPAGAKVVLVGVAL